MAVAWTFLYGATEQPLAAWPFADMVLERHNQDVDRLTATMPAAALADAAIPIGGLVTLKRNGTPFFYGRRTELPDTIDGRTEAHSYSFAGPWHWLDKIVFERPWYIVTQVGGGGNTTVTKYSPHVLLPLDNNGVKCSTRDEIILILQFAIAAGAPFQIGNILTVGDAVYPPFKEFSNINCAGALRNMLQWHRDAVQWFDYATTPPTLHIQPRAALAALSLGIAGDGLRISGLKSDEEAAPSCVALKYEQINQIAGKSFPVLYYDIAPAGAIDGASGEVKETYRDGALIMGINLQGQTSTYNTSRLSLKPLNASNADFNTQLFWWRAHDPTLNGDLVGDIILNGFTNVLAIDSAGAPANLADWPWEITRGAAADWMNVPYDELTVSCTVNLTLDGQAITRFVTVTIRVVNCAATGTTLEQGQNVQIADFSSLQSIDSGEPLPVGLASYLFAQLSTRQYSGMLTLTEQEVGSRAILGAQINIPDGLAAWAEMNALPTRLKENIFTGETTITLGAPGHLTANDLIELLNANRLRIRWTAPKTISDGSLPGSNIQATRGGALLNTSSATTANLPWKITLVKNSIGNPDTCNIAGGWAELRVDNIDPNLDPANPPGDANGTPIPGGGIGLTFAASDPRFSGMYYAQPANFAVTDTAGYTIYAEFDTTPISSFPRVLPRATIQHVSGIKVITNIPSAHGIGGATARRVLIGYLVYNLVTGRFDVQQIAVANFTQPNLVGLPVLRGMRSNYGGGNALTQDWDQSGIYWQGDVVSKLGGGGLYKNPDGTLNFNGNTCLLYIHQGFDLIYWGVPPDKNPQLWQPFIKGVATNYSNAPN